MSRKPIVQSVLEASLAGACAGGLGWGIRGQYGHETGAMLSGVLVGFAILCVVGRHLSWQTIARAVALLAVGVGFGGAETYGQTIGLTQDRELVGNHAALAWGMLGLFVKGGVWIGIAGAFFGIGLGGVRYTSRECAAGMLGLMGLWLLGEWIFHTPFEPPSRKLPPIYFSATWDWFPDKSVLEPRLERWGALLLVWVGLLGWRGIVRRDTLAWRLGLVGFVAGGIGFAGGQCIQAAHAWHPELFARWFGRWDPLINWWNIMEITFGSVWGAALGAAVAGWQSHLREPLSPPKPFAAPLLATLIVVQLALLTVWTFLSIDTFDTVADRALPMGLIPLLIATRGGWGAAWVSLGIVAAPIAAKTFHGLCVENHDIAPILGFVLFGALPLILLASGMPWRGNPTSGRFCAKALLASALVFFWLNLAFFRFPWPWEPPTGRSPSLLIFSLQMLVLGWVAWRSARAIDGTGLTLENPVAAAEPTSNRPE